MSASVAASPVGARAALDAELIDFTAATPALLAQRQLLSRVDSKYVACDHQIAGLLAALRDDYAVLRVASGPIATYQSLYFDSASLQCFHDHRRGRRIRHKVRIRHYPDRQVSYLEVKTKRNATVTDKQRRKIAYGTTQLGDADLAFLRLHVATLADQLAPALWMGFARISLIGRTTVERVTIDLGLIAGQDGDDAQPLPGIAALAVIEVKQPRFCVRTPAMRALAGAGLRAASMSKYVVAQALTRPGLRRNRLLPGLRTLEALAR